MCNNNWWWIFILVILFGDNCGFSLCNNNNCGCNNNCGWNGNYLWIILLALLCGDNGFCGLGCNSCDSGNVCDPCQNSSSCGCGC